MEYTSFDFLYKDVTICIFDDRREHEDPTVAFLVRIRRFDSDTINTGGVVYANNPYRMAYHQELSDDNKRLDVIYKVSKRKILARDFMKLGWEGKILNEPKYS